MHLSRATVESLVRCVSPHVRTRSGNRAFTLVCTVEEGAACRFGPGEWGDPLLERIAPAVIDDLGWKEIEHSVRREVVIRCSAPDEDPMRAVCEIDRGDGFEPLVVVAETPAPGEKA